MSRLAVALSVCMFAGLGVGCGSPSSAICNRQLECLREADEDVGSAEDQTDDVAVCAAAFEGQLATLRANSEPECKEFADAVDAQSSCRAGLSCDALLDADPDCADEQERLDTLAADINADGIACQG